MPTLEYTLETPLGSDPNFPDGYQTQSSTVFGGQAFDFGRNWFYQAILGLGSASGVGGITITDLSTMQVIRTATMDQMYAGTAFGSPPGTPWSQTVYQCNAGNNTDLYILAAGTGTLPNEWARFTRIDPVTMKVTGEFYVTTGFPPPINNVGSGGWQSGLVNTTATRTIVLYPANGALTATGAELFDGTGMAPIGLGPRPMQYNYNVMYDATAKYPDGSCDFVMMDPDSWAHPTSGNIDIWRIHVSNSLVITSVKTGTLNILPYFTPPATTNRLFVGQIEYDPLHDTLIVTVPDGGVSATTPNGKPSWLLSVNWNGSVNWAQPQADIGGSVYSNSQYNMTSAGTYMAGSSDNLHLYDTATGAILFTGSILVGGTPAGSFYHVWDAARNAYWTNALARGFVRIDFIADEIEESPDAVIESLTDAELFFTPTPAFVDFSDAANRRKFVAADGGAQYIGPHGGLPFNTTPAVYLTAQPHQPRTFADNNGTGGAFTIYGDGPS